MLYNIETSYNNINYMCYGLHIIPNYIIINYYALLNYSHG